ncbi:hypothetical protein PJM29_28685, partial [Mycobacterium kansasii]
DAASDIPPASLGRLADELRAGIAAHCATLDRPPSTKRRRRAPADTTEATDESELVRDAEPLDDTVPVVDHVRSGHPVTSHRRRRPSHALS